MKLPVSLVNYNPDALNLYIPLLSGNSVAASHAPSMQDALVMLLDTEYSGIVINGDKGDYLSPLRVMRKLAAAPIGVSVTRYNQDEYLAAVTNGADIFRVRYDGADRRVERFASLAKIYVEYCDGQQAPMTVMTHGKLQVFPHTCKVFVRGAETPLVPKEFDILYYLITNKGITLTYGQIYRRVWGDEYVDNSRNLLWVHIGRLRDKLQTAPGLPEYIVTECNYGYAFSTQKKPEKDKS